MINYFHITFLKDYKKTDEDYILKISLNYLDNDLYLDYNYLDLELNKDCDKQLIVSKAVSIHFGITGVYFLINLIFGNKIKFSSVE